MLNDYFTAQMGFVIDGERCGSKDKAMAYLTNSGCMEPEEAEHYLARLFRTYRKQAAVSAN